MRILLVGVAIEGGGAEQVIVDLARGLKARQHDVMVAFLEGTDQVVPSLEAKGIICQRLLARQKYAVGPLADFTPSSIFAIRKLVKQFRPDVIHCHIPRPTLWTALAARLGRLGAPLIYTEHSIQEIYPGWAKWVYRSFLPMVSQVIGVSDASANSFRNRWGWPESRVQRIWNGIDVTRMSPTADPAQTRRELGAADDDVIICNVGKLSGPKAQEILIAAVAELLPQLPKLRCWIAGGFGFEPATAQFVQETIKTHRMEERLQLLSIRRDVPNLIAATDVFCLSSRQEGFPITILEAMAAGKPVVATDVGGCAEAVAHGETGLIVPPEDPHALAEALKQILSNPDQARQMGEAGRRRVLNNFTLETMIDRHIQTYQKVITRS